MMLFPHERSHGLRRSDAGFLRNSLPMLRLMGGGGVLFVLGCMFSVYAAAQDEASRKSELVKLMQGLKLEPVSGTTNPLCKAFLDDFRRQKNIEHIAPTIKTDDYNDPRLAPYKNRCPKLDFHKSRVPVGAAPHKVQLPPERQKEAEENDDNYTIFLDTKNLQLYELEMDDNLANGKEIIFYGEAPKVVSSGGIPRPDGPIYNAHLGEYRVIGLESCSYLGGISIGESWGSSGGPVESHGVFRYREKNVLYYFRMYEKLKYVDGSLHGPIAYLTLSGWKKDYQDHYRITSVCSYETPRK